MLFEDTRQHTHGVRAQRSCAGAKYHLHAIRFQPSGNVRTGVFDADARVAQRDRQAHSGDATSNHTVLADRSSR